MLFCFLSGKAVFILEEKVGTSKNIEQSVCIINFIPTEVFLRHRRRQHFRTWPAEVMYEGVGGLLRTKVQRFQHSGDSGRTQCSSAQSGFEKLLFNLSSINYIITHSWMLK